ncbi:MAG: GMP synthase (glutamine-hydrolysing) [Parcubacteria group bacterium Gr01-1014_8]|nr:MAG: GMP synthase (glutamine-hydrolysing) [Parcubacteria group bacterium Gr01-1014_8]
MALLSLFKNATPEALSALAEELRIRKATKYILLFSMGSQFDHLIVQRLARIGIYALVADPASVKADDVLKAKPAGIILSGGPASVFDEPPPFDVKIFDLGIPLLGVCLGYQQWAKHIGARVSPHEKREFGVHTLRLKKKDPLFKNVPAKSPVLQTHGDKIFPFKKLVILGATENSPIAAGRYKHLWGVQFHPEVTDTKYGEQIYSNFCVDICGITNAFPAHSVAKLKIAELKEKIGDKNVVIALSGGSDSSVVAYLLKHAMKSSRGKLLGVYIRGIDRPDDEAYVKKHFGKQKWLQVKVVDATIEFLQALSGKTRMRDKRVAMRSVYQGVLEKEIESFGAEFIAQGTLYTDLRESGLGNATGARIAEIKVHHNTGIDFSVAELRPLEDMVKDSARDIGRDIGVPEDMLVRHPFPGPGLVVRIEGEVTAETLKVARAIDGIYIDELRTSKLYDTVWQAGAVVTRSEHTESKGDGAGMGCVVALWAIWSVNGFTARFAQLPYDFLDKVSRRITNEVREVGAVVYRVSAKPPATIEWG